MLSQQRSLLTLDVESFLGIKQAVYAAEADSSLVSSTPSILVMLSGDGIRSTCGGRVGVIRTGPIADGRPKPQEAFLVLLIAAT